MAWYRRLFNLSRRQRVGRNIDRELEFHLAERIDELVASGESPEEAAQIARRQFGNYSLQKERTRDMDVLAWLESVLADVRYAIRGLLRTPGFTTVAILTLALGIGTNTALFSAADGLLFEKLQVARPEELVALRWIGNYNPAVNVTYEYGEWTDVSENDGSSAFSFVAFKRFRESTQTLTDVFAFAPQQALNIRIGDREVRTEAQFVSGNYYRALGVSAITGRTLVLEDDAATAPPAVVISEGYWRRQYGGDPTVLGKSIVINNVPMSVVGIVPETTGDLLRPRTRAPEVSVPLALQPLLRPDNAEILRSTSWWLVVMGRLAPGMSIPQVETELAPVLDAIVPDEPAPPNRRLANPMPPALDVISAVRGVYHADFSEVTALRMFSAVFGVVFVIVCVNLASLSLSRSEVRHKEVVVRMAIGAGRGRVMRQILTESMVLAFFGGVAGVIVAAFCQYLPRIAAFPIKGFQMDSTSLWFAISVSMLASLSFGLAPAIRSAKGPGMVSIKAGGIQHTRRRSLVGKSLVTVQVALSLVLLVGAGLLLRTVANLRSVPTGFNTENVITFYINSGPAVRQYTPEQMTLAYEQILDRLRALPGIVSAGLASVPLISGMSTGTTIALDNWEPDIPRERVNVVIAGPAFIKTLEIPLRGGRSFVEGDYQVGPQVAVVNEAFIRQFLPETAPLGRRIRYGPPTNTPVEIVGVVADTKYSSLRDDASPIMYLSAGRQRGVLPFRANIFYVRTGSDTATVVPAIRQAVNEVVPSGPDVSISTQMRNYEGEWVYAMFSVAFGTIALLVSMIGLVGLMSYVVAQRTKEIGIRVALGAQAGQIRRSIVRESLTFVGIGVVIGIGLSVFATRSLEAFLFGLAPRDPINMVTSALLMIGVAALASYLPARRASRVDPLVALRHE